MDKTTRFIGEKGSQELDSLNSRERVLQEKIERIRTLRLKRKGSEGQEVAELKTRHSDLAQDLKALEALEVAIRKVTDRAPYANGNNEIIERWVSIVSIALRTAPDRSKVKLEDMPIILSFGGKGKMRISYPVIGIESMDQRIKLAIRGVLETDAAVDDSLPGELVADGKTGVNWGNLHDLDLGGVVVRPIVTMSIA